MKKKKLDILQKVREILFFADQDLGRFGNKYLLKYYLVLCIVQFYLLPSPLGNPGTSPALQVSGVGNCLKQSCPGGKVGGANKKKYLLFDFAKYQLFLAWFTQWLRTSTLHIFKEKCRNLSESGWGGIIYQNYSLYLKVCFNICNECAYDAYSNRFIFWKGRQKY